MDIGAIVLSPFDVAHLSTLHEALAETCEEYGFEPDQLAAAYSADSGLGNRLILHIMPRQAVDGDVDYDPRDFYKATERAGHFGPGDFGTSLSGYFWDRVSDETPQPTSYTCVWHPAINGVLIEHGMYYTFEGRDFGEGSTAVARLSDKLDIEDAELLEGKLETADIGPFPITDPPPQHVVDQLADSIG